MSSSVHLIDDAPLTRFHKKLTTFSSGGPFIDGYALSIIGIALITMTPALDLGPSEIGMVGAASLVGIFFGGGVFGWVTDKVGRHTMYILDLIALAVFSILSAFSTDIWQLVHLALPAGCCHRRRLPHRHLAACRVPAQEAPRPAARGDVRGLGHRRRRGLRGGLRPARCWPRRLALHAGQPRDLRHHHPALPPRDPRVPALAALPRPGRRGPRRHQEGLRREVRHRVPGRSNRNGSKQATFTDIFNRKFWRRTLFVSIFWTAQVIPLFAVYTFAPDLLASFGMDGDANLYGGSLLISLIFVVGGIPGLWLVERIGRRKLLLWSFGIIVVALAAPAFIPNVAPQTLFTALAIFALASGASSFLEVVYPNELFPTEIRATAVGFGTAISRVGSAASTYLMPVAIISFGAAGALLIGAGISLVGLVATFLLAPETANRSLSETTSRDGRSEDPEQTSTEPLNVELEGKLS